MSEILNSKETPTLNYMEDVNVANILISNFASQCVKMGVLSERGEVPEADKYGLQIASTQLSSFISKKLKELYKEEL